MRHRTTTTRSQTSTLAVMKSPPDLHEQIRRRAYQLYEQRGRNDGHELGDWLRRRTVEEVPAGANAGGSGTVVSDADDSGHGHSFGSYSSACSTKCSPQTCLPGSKHSAPICLSEPIPAVTQTTRNCAFFWRY